MAVISEIYVSYKPDNENVDLIRYSHKFDGEKEEETETTTIEFKNKSELTFCKNVVGGSTVAEGAFQKITINGKTIGWEGIGHEYLKPIGFETVKEAVSAIKVHTGSELMRRILLNSHIVAQSPSKAFNCTVENFEQTTIFKNINGEIISSGSKSFDKFGETIEILAGGINFKMTTNNDGKEDFYMSKGDKKSHPAKEEFYRTLSRLEGASDVLCTLIRPFDFFQNHGRKKLSHL